MIECSNAGVRDLLPDVVRGGEGLSRQQRSGVEAHLATCPACREELALLESVRRAYAAAPAVDVDRIAAALPRPAAPRRSSVRSVGWQRAAAIALAAVGVSSLLMVRTLGPGDSRGQGVDSVPVSGTTAVEGPAVALGYRLSELSEADLEALLGTLDELEALPAAEPAPIIAPLGAGEGS